jgi:hypothetical protein
VGAVIDDEFLVSILPIYISPKTLLTGKGLPCHAKKIEITPVRKVLTKMKRRIWKEGLYVSLMDLEKIIRYKNTDGSYKNDFVDFEFFQWVQNIENNTALCEMESKRIGWGVFVPPGKILTKGTFIPAAGIIKLNPTLDELETEVHCSALQDLNSADKKIIGIINPNRIGGILNFINHAPEKNELSNFTFKDPAFKKIVATANLNSVIKFFNGYAIMGLEAPSNIVGGRFGKQLLWSYARSCEYITTGHSKSKQLVLFDNRDGHNGSITDPAQYDFQYIDIFIASKKLILQKAATMTRWELMQDSPQSNLFITPEDSYAATNVPSVISLKLIQDQLELNPKANRVIIQPSFLK